MNLPTLPTPDRKNIPFMVLAGVPILIIALAILNYFNIVPLSQKWPNQFSILPHLPPKPIYLKTEPIAAVNKPIVSENKFSSSEVAPKVGSDLMGKLKVYLKPTYLPSSLDVTQIKDDKGKVIDSKRFNSSWNKEQVRADATVRYNEDTYSPNIGDFELFLTIPRITQTLTAQTAKEILSDYLINNSNQSLKCSQINFPDAPSLPTQVICESFSLQDKAKLGVGVITPTIDGKGSSIFACEFYPGSPFYDWKSCNVAKANTGI